MSYRRKSVGDESECRIGTKAGVIVHDYDPEYQDDDDNVVGTMVVYGEDEDGDETGEPTDVCIRVGNRDVLDFYTNEVSEGLPVEELLGVTTLERVHGEEYAYTFRLYSELEITRASQARKACRKVLSLLRDLAKRKLQHNDISDDTMVVSEDGDIVLCAVESMTVLTTAYDAVCAAEVMRSWCPDDEDYQNDLECMIDILLDGEEDTDDSASSDTFDAEDYLRRIRRAKKCEMFQ